MWSQNFIKLEDQRAVENAVQVAEKKTIGEIVPMIVRSSSTVGHVSALIFLILAAFISFSDIFLLRLEASANEWLYYFFGDRFNFNIILLLLNLILLIGSYILANYLARFAFLQRLLTSDFDLELQCRNRAELEFYWSKANETREQTGILIFLSLMEHRCIVLADKSIAAKLPPETWQGVVDAVLAGVKKNRPSEGLINAVQICGAILAQHFPIQPGNTNELSNKLIIKE